MPSTIDVSFIEQYDSMLHVRYQHQGFLYKGMTREGTVQGKRIYWQRIGELAAQQKPRNGQLTPTDPTHTRVFADPADWYTATLIDSLDELKQNINEMQAHANLQMMAIGRKFDEIVRAAIAADAVSDLGGGSTVTFTVDHMHAVSETLMLAYAPMGEGAFCAVGPRTWTKMMGIDEFANADYVGQENLPYAGNMTAKMWRGVMWFVDPVIGNDTTYWDAATAVETNLIWHKDAVGHGINKAPSSNVAWENLHQAHSIVTCMSTGAKTIEENSTYTWSVDTNA